MLRVGSVPYFVGRPLDLGLEDEAGIAYHRAVPAELVEGLRAGTIDVALVSSIELFRRPGYGFLAELAVAGESTVSSVQIFLKKPLEEVNTVALDPASRTSVVLAQVSWPAERRPRFLELERGEDPRRHRADAWLRIGDRALQELWAPDPADGPLWCATWNPSQAWRERTGLPFVFAPWIVRAGVDVGPHLAAFRRARERGRAQTGALAREAARELGLEVEPLTRYLAKECLYEPGERLGRALLAFRDRAAALGLVDAELEPTCIPLDAPVHRRAPSHAD